MHQKVIFVLKEIKLLVTETIKQWLDDNMMLHAAGLAFYTIFSLAPLLVIIIALTGFFFGEQAASGQLSSYMEEIVGAELAEAVENIVSAVSGGTTGTFASIISTFILIFAATTVLTQLKESLNTIWSVDKSLKQPVKMFFINRLLSLALIFILATALIATFFISTIVSIISPFLSQIFPEQIAIYSFLNSIFFVLVGTLLFSIIYKLLPDIRVKWSDVLVGAFVTSLLFLLGRYLVTYYLTNAAMSSTYGAAGSFVIFLIWVYYNVMVIFLGAEFTQIYTRRYGSEVRPGRYLRKKKVDTPIEKKKKGAQVRLK
jgi:membrane protein